MHDTETTESERPAFGEALRRYREAAGLTQEALAERAEMSVRALIYLERNVHRPYAATVRRLARALALAPAERSAFEALARQGGAPAAAQGRASNLPRPVTPLIGREREVAEVARLLRTARLLTLIGAGGVGKTRLAVAVAAQEVNAYPDGVVFVDLAPLADPALVPAALAVAAGVQATGGRSLLERVAEALRSRQLLIVLDNCEHLVDACAGLADHLLRTCPHVRVLATSRGALGLTAERLWHVPPLALPRADDAAPEALVRYAAVRLFVERAAAVSPGFALRAANASAVAAICRRLDGIPLAIELAAARVRVLSPAQIAARLHDRFRLLTGGERTAVPRHQTLQALVDWSYALLSSSERTVLRRLSIFAGGWTLAAAEAVCTDAGLPAPIVLDLLGGLVDQSLVVVDEGAGDGAGEMRYRFLETIRQYAAERLEESGERDALRQVHGTWALTLVQRQVSGEWAASPTVIAPLTTDYDNICAALAWSLEQQDGGLAALQLTTACASCNWTPHYHGGEGRRWLERALAHAATTVTPERAEALSAAGALAWMQADRAGARACYREALAAWRALDDAEGERRILVLLGLPGMDRADQDAAYAIMAAAVTADGALPAGLAGLWNGHRAVGGSAESERTALLARVCLLLLLSQIDRVRGRDATACTWLERAVALLRPEGPPGYLVHFLCDLSATLAMLGDWATAEARLAEAQAIIPLAADGMERAGALHAIASAAWLQGDYPLAGTLWEARLALVRAHGDGVMWNLMHLGDVAWQQGDLSAARACYDESLALAEAEGQPLGLALLLHHHGLMALAAGNVELADHLASRSLEHAREMDAGWHVANALALQAGVAFARGDPARANALYQDSLRQLRASGDIDMGGALRLHCIDGLAAVAAHAGVTDRAQQVRAARLYDAATTLRRTLRSPRAPTDEAIHGRISAVLRADAPMVTAEAPAGLLRQPISLDQVVAGALEQP